jgi:hypothetical protein
MATPKENTQAVREEGSWQQCREAASDEEHRCVSPLHAAA